jgi:outer membrane scaffolding protein for murein synthesis (MipA/OmpV family)
MARFGAVVAGLVLFAGSRGLRASETEDFEAWARVLENVESTDSLEPGDEPYVRDNWYTRVGVVGGGVPGYLGSDHYEGSWSPSWKIVWRDTLFLVDRQFGWNAYKDDDLAVGPYLRYSGGRSDNNDGLEGMGDIDRTLMAGAFINYRHGPLRFKSEVRQDVLDQKQGAVAVFRLGTKVPWNGTPLFTAYVSTTWASSVYMQSFFGVNAAQSARTGLPAYHPGSGIRDVSVSISSGYGLTGNWSVSAQAEYRRLLGDAADSPLVEDTGSANQFVIGAGLNYTF